MVICGHLLTMYWFVGSPNRLLTCDDDILSDIWSWCEQFTDCPIFIAGDFNNAVLDNDNDACSRVSCEFASHHSLIRCDNLYTNQKKATYVNHALNQASQIDYMLCSKPDSVTVYTVLDHDINFSDHVPLYAKISCTLISEVIGADANNDKENGHTVKLLRWDHGDLSV